MGTIERCLRKIEKALEEAAKNLGPDGYRDLIQEAKELVSRYEPA